MNEERDPATDQNERRPQLNRRATSGPIKFKHHASSDLSGLSFPRSQIWVDKADQDQLLFVDQNEANDEESRRRALSRKRQRTLAKTVQAQQVTGPVFRNASVVQPASPPGIQLWQAHSLSPTLSFDTSQQFPTHSLHDSYGNSVSHVESPSLPDNTLAEQPWPPSGAEGRRRSDVQFKIDAWYPGTASKPEFRHGFPTAGLTPRTLYEWPSQFTTLESACLMRAHMDLLAKWADAGYSTRHFSITLHKHALSFPPLLQAMLAASATHLVKTPAHQNSDGVIEYKGVVLPGLTKESVIRIHDICVASLRKYCDEHSDVHDDKVLAALTMLRYHEELLSHPGEGRNTGRLFHVFNAFVTARDLHNTPRSQDPTSPLVRQYRPEYFKSLRHAIHRLALRQELTSAYMEQAPLNINLEPWLALDEMFPKDLDSSIWADKCLLQCALTINLCFGSDRANFTADWNDLKGREVALENLCPQSCSPLIWQQVDSKVFPLIWYDSLCPITGMQWLGLAKLLLVVHNPNLPRIGPKVLQSQRSLAQESREIIRTICGIAESDSSAQPAYVQAQMAIMAGGAYFTDQSHQKAMLAILSHLEYQFGWPTSTDVSKLKDIWGQTG